MSTARATGRSRLQIGSPEALVAPVHAGPEAFAATRRRGLVMKELTLHRTGDIFSTRGEIYYLATGFTLNGEKPTVFPIGDADKAILRLDEGETFHFSLGQGAPVFPPTELVGGLSLQIHVFDSDGGARRAGETMKKAADAVRDDGKVLDLLAKLAKPEKIALDLVAGAAGEITKVVGAILESNSDDQIDFFTGFWSADDPWDGQLDADQRGASIRLAEVTAPL